LNSIPQHIDELIAKVLAGEAMREEVSVVESWRKESSGNEKYFEHFSTIFQRAEPSSPKISFDADVAWKKVSARIFDAKERKVVSMKRTSWFTPLRVAASVALLIGISAVFYFMSGNEEPQFAMNSTNEIVQDSLPDGSMAVLNKHSSLSYSFDEKKKLRKAKLEGEAYFEVVHDETQTFIVETQDVFVQDIGTAFNVKSTNTSDTIEVFVNEGEVKFYKTSESGINLIAGETGYYIKSSQTFSKLIDADENKSSYANRTFNFRNASLKRVVKKLNEVYDTKLALSSAALDYCRISVRFEDEEIETIAAVIAETLELEIQQSRGRILSSGEGCE